jgi:photosystem II stability/assembly factor-like uncharacterized protein
VNAQIGAVAGLILLAVVVGGAQPARAHELPRGVSLLWADAEAADPALVVTNRGLVYLGATADDPALRCNEAYGATQARMPHVWLSEAGRRTFVVTDDHIRYTDNDACGFTDATGVPPDTLFTSLARGGAGQSLVLVAVLKPDGTESRLYASDDQGLQFAPRGTAVADETWDALLVAPSDPSRVYAAGKRIDRVAQRLSSVWSYSIDGGRTFTRVETPTDRTPVFVHPERPDQVFAAQPTDALKSQFELLRSDDGGKTFRSVLSNLSTVPRITLGYANGEVWLGTGRAGALYHSDDGGEHFAKVHDEVHEVHCLVQRGERLWLCGNFAPNTDGVFFADANEGEFRPFLTFDQVRTPVPCGDTVCELPFADYARELFPDAGTADGGNPDADASVAVVPTPDAADAAALDAATSAEDGAEIDPAPPATSRKDGCTLHSGEPGSLSAWLGLLSAVAIGLRLQRSFSRRASTSGFSGSRR